MGKLSIEVRKTRLIGHMYNRLCEEIDNNSIELHKWCDELDALQDILHNNKQAMTEWTVTKDNELLFTV
jgi:hypothetical protein